MTPTHFFGLTALMAAVTFGTKFLPFVVFARGARAQWVHRLAPILPGALSAALVVACFFDGATSPVATLAQSVALMAVVGLQLLFNNVMLSMVAGTVINVLIVQGMGS